MFTLSKNPKNLVGHCGLYCGACGIYQGRIKQAVENLQKIVGYYGFDKIAAELAKWEPAFEHYAEFENVLKGLITLFGECPGCLEGGGDPNCSIRECCRQKGYVICAECTQMIDCKRLRQYNTKEELQKIKTIGIGKWAEEMQKKVDAGYCHLDEKLE